MPGQKDWHKKPIALTRGQSALLLAWGVPLVVCLGESMSDCAVRCAVQRSIDTSDI